MKHLFFGNPNAPLFGVHHPVRQTTSPIQAAVICPPFGQEFIRTHWCLRTLANQLARSGIHTFRFDHSGLGDSAGNPLDVLSLNHWIEDIHLAIDHVIQETSAQNVMLVGLRWGAHLAAMAARDNANVNSLILWEPVVCGRDMLNEIRAMHQEMIDLWVCKITTPDDQHSEEILGSRYARSLLRDIGCSVLDEKEIQQPHLIVDLQNENVYEHSVPGLQKVTRVDDENTWNNLAFLESAWLRGQSSRYVCQSAQEMFERLQRFAAMEPTNFATAGASK